MKIDPNAGKLPDANTLVNIPKLVAEYYTSTPDPYIESQKVVFGTSGHRGSSFERSFNEWHILAITQAICEFRAEKGIDGPLFLGMDTHALAVPAASTCLEVLAAHSVEVMLADNDDYTPTPVISHAILTFNKGKKSHLSDGIVITPSHNPPSEGGIKYNSSNGGPAEVGITSWIERRANEILKNKVKDVKRISLEKAAQASTTHRFNYREHYINDLKNVIDMQLIKDSGISLGVDPLGGAGVHYWNTIADKYQIHLSVVNEMVDPTFRFVPVDWDGKIRMDPSSEFAMQGLLKLRDQFDVAFACDTDHDRHGIVSRKSGLLPSNHYLTVAIDYLFQNRPKWSKQAAVGKTVVSSEMIDRITARLGRRLYEVPVGFKWFVEGLFDGSLSFVGEESAGASFSRFDGSVWTTDKDGIILALLAGEITAKTKLDPGEIYQNLTVQCGAPVYERWDVPATPKQKEILKNLSENQVHHTKLAGEPIKSIWTKAPGNQAPIGGIKVLAENGWFAARPSGTENIYKIYAESFLGKEHLKKIQAEAQEIIDKTLQGKV